RVAVRAVAREIDPVVAAPVLLLEALRIAPDVAQHPRPRLLDHEEAALRRAHGAAAVVVDVRGDTGERPRRRAGLGRDLAGQRRYNYSAGLRLPPRVDDRAALAPDHAVVPDPRLRVDRLADRAEQPQRRQ